ncbi:DUF1328 family protein [Sorangium sp. So ce375]|uniref:DUF1328 family protein n=1 Tax=Sorangium sp. So ce375 TaxID=3133306 RepID=UPI003F5C1D27
MLSWSVAFFLVAIIAAILGFGVLAASAAALAKLLFVIFLVLALVSLALGRRVPT